MKMTSLTINGRTVSRLFINGREVALGSTSSEALCFTAKQSYSTIQLTKVGSPGNITLQTSTNGKSWTPYNIGDTITVPNAGGKVYFAAVGSNYTLASSPENYHRFDFIGEFEASGNINSLLEEDPNIARTMSLEGKNFCYVYLFSGAALTTAPELPATTLAYGCYAGMFQGCTSLTQAPVLPAGDLIDSCYAYMFQGCTSLNYVLAGFYNWEQNATSDWLNNVAATGTFICPSTLIGNTPEDQRSTSTVPSSWIMTA